jgi:hypothetical protein
LRRGTSQSWRHVHTHVATPTSSDPVVNRSIACLPDRERPSCGLTHGVGAASPLPVQRITTTPRTKAR